MGSVEAVKRGWRHLKYLEKLTPSNMKIKTVSESFDNCPEIHFGTLKSFTNICPVTKLSESVTVEVWYTPSVQKDKYTLIEIGSFREFCANGFNCHVEKICDTIFNEILSLVNPEKLIVKVYLNDLRLTNWDCCMTRE